MDLFLAFSFLNVHVSLCKGLDLFEGVDLVGIYEFYLLTTKKLTFSDGRSPSQKAENPSQTIYYGFCDASVICSNNRLWKLLVRDFHFGHNLQR